MTIAPPAALVGALREAMRGEVDDSARRRAEYSSDASNYRVVPLVVAYPKDVEDILAALAVARDASVPLTMRGGGTSVAGNAVGTGLVLDTSRHMNRVLSVDRDARTARVEPGAILATLQRAAAPHGLRFGPDPSTLTRATLGGMIGNNACGPHAVAFGRTSDNVLSLDAVDGTGRRFTAADDLDAVPGLAAWTEANLAMIRPEFGRFSRQVSGYSPEHLLPENGHSLARFLVGTEGTLATVLEAEVRLVEVPKARLTGVFGYDDMPSAADAVPALLPHAPQAVEGLDAHLVERVRSAPGRRGIPELPEAPAGSLSRRVGRRRRARAAMDALAADAGAISHASSRTRRRPRPSGPSAPTAPASRAAPRTTSRRGRAGRTPPSPPRTSARTSATSTRSWTHHGVHGQPYGHFGDGCVHVRLDIPLGRDGADLRSFMDDAAALVARHGGSLSGEHGDGRARSELLRAMYSPEALRAFGEVKHLFDPETRSTPASSSTRARSTPTSADPPRRRSSAGRASRSSTTTAT